MRAHPWLVGGTGRLETVLMSEVPGTLAKSGAEGVLVAALPDGTALAAKVDDGHSRALGPVLLDVLAAAGVPVPPEVVAVAAPVVVGGGRPVGRLRTRPRGARTRSLGGVTSPNVSQGAGGRGTAVCDPDAPATGGGAPPRP